jgi:hypothetical protein
VQAAQKDPEARRALGVSGLGLRVELETRNSKLRKRIWVFFSSLPV